MITKLGRYVVGYIIHHQCVMSFNK